MPAQHDSSSTARSHSSSTASRLGHEGPCPVQPEEAEGNTWFTAMALHCARGMCSSRGRRRGGHTRWTAAATFSVFHNIAHAVNCHAGPTHCGGTF